MRDGIIFFICVILAGLLQATVFTDLNLLLLLSVFAGFRKGPLAGLLIGGTIGIFGGILSVSPFALNLALYSIVGFLSGLASVHMYYKENIFVQAMFSFCGLLLFYLVYCALTATIRTAVVSTVLFSAAVSPLIFRILDYCSS